MHALHQEVLPPSGVEFATSLKLIPGTYELPPSTLARHEIASRVICNVVVARSNLLRIFEVREEPALATSVEGEEKGRGKAEKDAELEHGGGDVEMSEAGNAKVINCSTFAHSSCTRTVGLNECQYSFLAYNCDKDLSRS